MPIKSLAPNRHLRLIEWILHNVVRIKLVHPPHDDIDIRLLRLREEQKLSPADRLEAGQPEQRALQDLEAGELRARYRRRPGVGLAASRGGRRWVRYCARCEGACDGVHAVECAREDEVVVCGELREGRVEGAVVD